jgi:hypothetical protein
MRTVFTSQRLVAGLCSAWHPAPIWSPIFQMFHVSVPDVTFITGYVSIIFGICAPVLFLICLMFVDVSFRRVVLSKILNTEWVFLRKQSTEELWIQNCTKPPTNWSDRTQCCHWAWQIEISLSP